MAYKQIIELSPSAVRLEDAHVIEGQVEGSASSQKYTGAQVRAVEQEERQIADATIAEAVGLDNELNFIDFVGTNYIDSSTTIADAISILDATLGEDFMDKDTYDPDRKEANMWNMDNMVNGNFHKILTNAAQNIEGVKTFINQPKYAGTPIANEDLINLGYLTDEFGDPTDIMKKSIYDPTSIEGDVFDMDNMVEGDVNKILTNETQLIKGEKTFDIFPFTPETIPTKPYEVANKYYVDSAVSGIKGEASASIEYEVVTTGTAPTVTNENKYIDINLTSVETPSKVTLGNMAAKVFWEGTMAQYQAIGTKNDNTIYYIYE
jgi:hypothetical protein